MDAKSEIWCDRDEHEVYENYVDFNEWLDSDDGEDLRVENNITDLSQPSKAFFAGDKEAYLQAFEEYRIERRHENLNKDYLCQQFNGEHWFQRNAAHFDQLVNCMIDGAVVPFIGAGLSVEGGFPTWKEHLRQQGRTAGINPTYIEDLLMQGRFESVIEEIESIRGRDVFIQEIRDAFSIPGTITDTTLQITELFPDTIVTTNYDRLIEQAFIERDIKNVQVINAVAMRERPIAGNTAIYKLHGDIHNPGRCILGKNQYDVEYGATELDLALPIPKLISYYYKNSTQLFLGCSLNNDRTIEVFRAAKREIGNERTPQHFSIEQAPEDEDAVVRRNAHLASLGISAIWFEKGRFDNVGSLLRLLRNEMRYRGISLANKKMPEIIPQPDAILELGMFGRLKRFMGL